MIIDQLIIIFTAILMVFAFYLWEIQEDAASYFLCVVCSGLVIFMVCRLDGYYDEIQMLAGTILDIQSECPYDSGVID